MHLYTTIRIAMQYNTKMANTKLGKDERFILNDGIIIEVHGLFAPYAKNGKAYVVHLLDEFSGFT